jgi:hypothetical protein
MSGRHRKSSAGTSDVVGCQPTPAASAALSVACRGAEAEGITIGANTRYVAQYGRTVYPGAVRYDASGGAGLTPFAFQNADGKWTVVVRVDSGRSFTVGGLPSGAYQVFHTTDVDYLQAQADVQTDVDGRITLQIPASGVITAHQR